MNNIYIDGSCQVNNRLIGIGIYNSTTKFELSMVKDGNNVFDAESEALEEAIRYSELNGIVKESRIFTDSKEVHKVYFDYVLSLGFSEFIWIPRELNSVADKLSTGYKEYTKSTRTKISLNNNVIIKTTKIKETTKVKSLSKTEIIEKLNEFSEEKRMKLIYKLKDLTKSNKCIYDYYFANGGKVGKNNKNTYFKLIPLLVKTTRSGKSQNNLLEEITLVGINTLLNNIKMKETK